MTTSVTTWRSAMICAAALGLGACGFQMRGQVALPEGIDKVYIEGPTVFTDELEVFIDGGGAEVVGTREGADATVSIRENPFSQRVIAVDPNTGKEREFELVYTMQFSVTRPDGTTALGPEQVRIVRDLLFDSDQVIGKSRERSLLEVEMRRDAAEEVVRRIEARLR